VNSFRVRTSAHIGTDLQVDGNLTVLGTQTTVGQSNVTQGAPFYRLNEGDAIGEAGTVFTGIGLDDAFFAGHFTGPTPQTYYVRIDGVGTGAGGVDTFEVALGNDSAFVSPVLTKQNITGEPQLIHSADNISVDFGSTTGHDSGDRWSGTASPINVDTGFFTNRNTGASGVGYTHMGFFFDVSDEKWKVLDEYDSTPTGIINVTDSSLGIMVAAGFEGPLTGNVTGNAATASALVAGRDFSLTGDITATAVNFDGTGNVQLTTAYNPGSIVNADISATAAIADTKLATISTPGKVQNGATTATNLNTPSTIVARDASGDFNAGIVRLTDLFVGNLHVDSADIISLARGSLSGGTGITYNSSTGAISTTDGDIVHDNLSGFVANEHIDHTTVSIIAGNGLTGGGTIAASRTIDIDSAHVYDFVTTTNHPSGSNNTIFGAGINYDGTGYSNVVIGQGAGTQMSTAFGSVIVGSFAAASVQTGGDNTILGYKALRYGKSGGNIAIGQDAMGGAQQGITGYAYNTAVGHSAMNGFSQTGIRNTAVGYRSGIDLTTGNYNTILGNYSGNQNGLDIRTSNNNIVLSTGSGIIGLSIDSGQTATFYDNVVAPSAVIGNLQVDSASIRGLFSASGDLSYNSGTGEFSFTERTNQEVRNLFSTSGDLAYDSATGQFSFSETYSTANELLTAIKTVDGGSSGLDADLLDGQEGTHYRINVYNASGTLLN
jgi:hypothetical protein